MGAPQTLPANFNGWDKPPATLPANFAQWDQSTNSAPAAQPQSSPPSFWDSLEREGKSAVGTIAGMPAAVYHAFSQPPTDEEQKEFDTSKQPPAIKQAAIGISRLTAAPVADAATWYSKAIRGKIPNAYEQALSVAPEAVGSAAGNTLGGKLVEMAPGAAQAATEAVAPAVRATARATNAALTEAPGAVGAAVGGYLGHETGIPEGTLSGVIIGRQLGKAVGKTLPTLRVPGEGFGLPNRVEGGPASAPEYEGEPAAAAPEEPAEPLAKVKAKTVRQSQSLGPNAQVLTEAQSLNSAPAPRSIVTDPQTGAPEFSDVVAAKQAQTAPAAETKAPPAATKPAQTETAAAPGPSGDVLLDRLRVNASKIQQEEAAKPGSADEDLTQQLQDSLAIVKARKAAQAAGKSQQTASGAGSSSIPEEIPAGGVRTTAAPKALLDRWGVDPDSFTQGRAQTRGWTPQESAASIDQLTKAYKNGQPVEPVLETRDAENNLIDVDGRGRALAAHRAGVERIPIIVRRLAPVTAQ